MTTEATSHDPQVAITQWLTLLRECCRQCGIPGGYTYAGIGDFLLQHGTWYQPQPLPRRFHHGAPRSCFKNALKLSRTRQYRYVEGYAVPVIEGLIFPTHHAWNLDRQGNVIDNTWTETGLAYFGVVFPVGVAKQAIFREGNTVLDNPRSRFELFRKPFEVGG